MPAVTTTTRRRKPLTLRSSLPEPTLPAGDTAAIPAMPPDLPAGAAAAVAAPAPALEPAPRQPRVLGEIMEDPDDPPSFFEYLASVPAARWEGDAIVYLYRKGIENAPGGRKYIARYTHAITEDEIQTQHGGGMYLGWFRDTAAGDSIRCTFAIEGTPKLRSDQRVTDAAIAGTTGAPPASGSAEGNAGAELAQTLVREMRAIFADRNQSSDQVLTTVIETMRKASDAGVDVMKAVQIEKAKQGDSLTGNVLLDRLVTSMIENYGKPQPAPALAAPQPSGTDKVLIQMALDGMRNPQAAGAGGKSFTEQVEEALRIADLVGGGGERGESTGNILRELGTLLSPVLQALPDLVNRWMSLEERKLGMQPGRPALPAGVPVRPQVIQAAPASLQPAGVAAAAPAAPDQAMQNKLVDDICAQIAHSFNEGDSGWEAEFVIRRAYPFAMELAKPMLADLGKVLQMAAEHPTLQPLTADPEFPKFAQEFVEAVQGKEQPGEPRPSEEDTEPNPGVPGDGTGKG